MRKGNKGGYIECLLCIEEIWDIHYVVYECVTWQALSPDQNIHPSGDISPSDMDTSFEQTHFVSVLPYALSIQ